MESLSQQICAYFDGDLTPDGEIKLRAWLLESHDHINDFLVSCFVHTQLIELLSPHQIRANALVAAESLMQFDPPPRARRRAGRIFAVAISVLFAIAFIYIVSRPSVVATITGTTDAKWASVSDKRTVGSLLEAGDEISVEGGTVRLTFAHGGQMALHGPGRFRVDSDTSGQLLLGSVSAFVPEHAVGFMIRTAKIKLVDLGTEFHIDLLADNSCELQVYSGLVEIQFDQMAGNGAAQKKLQISQGRAIRFDAPTGNVKTIAYNVNSRLPMSAWSQ